MAEDREQTIELLTATQVAMADLYYSIMEENPMLAKLMMDKMKSFLTKDCYAAMERQTVLMRFLQEHTNLDVIHEVLDCVNNCELKEDYTAIIMEWTYHNTEKIKKHYLGKCDGSLLCLNKQMEKPQFKKISNGGTDNYVKAIIQISTEILDDGDGGIEL